MIKSRVFSALLSGFSKLLPDFCVAMLPRLLTFLTSFDMLRRVTTADSVSVGFHYIQDEKEIGIVKYNLLEGYFVVFTWPPSFSPLRKVQELLRLLSFAVKIIRSEKC